MATVHLVPAINVKIKKVFTEIHKKVNVLQEALFKYELNKQGMPFKSNQIRTVQDAIKNLCADICSFVDFVDKEY